MLQHRLRRIKKSLKPKTAIPLKQRKITVEIECKSTAIINLVGYIILFLMAIDYSLLLISPELFEPTWAYNTAGKLIENVWGFLLGLAFIFYRRDQSIVKPKEYLVLKIISWLTLLIGISYFLITPVIVGNGLRIYSNTQAQTTAQIDLQKTQVEQYTQQLQQATPEQLSSLLQRYTAKQDNSEIPANSSQKIKNDLLAQVKQQQSQAEQQLTTEFNRQKQELFKTTFKWFVGAVVSGMCFILIWRHTQWARTKL